jgi:hypothetical protein
MRHLALAAAIAVVGALLLPGCAAQSYNDAAEMEWIYKDEHGYILLSNKPCTDVAVLANIKPQFRGDFRNGEVAPVGHPVLSVCYDAVDMATGYVHVVGPRGVTQFPMSMFTLLSKS